MAIQTRRGNEINFNPNKLLPGEWAVSLDTKYVRMCFAPGVVYRMATYESFEEDMIQIQQILATCEDIQTAVEAFEALAQQHASDAAASATAASGSATASKSWAVGGTGTRPGEDTDNAEYWAGVAQSAADVQIMTPTQIGIGKPDDVTIGVSNGTFSVKKPVNMGTYNGNVDDVPFVANAITVYRVSNAATNIPVAQFGILETMYIDSSPYAVQRYTALNTAITYTRFKNTTWQSWNKHIVDGNLVANLLATVAGNALDATMGKVLDDKITTNTTAITTLNQNLGFNTTEHLAGFYNGKQLYAKTVIVTKAVSATWQNIYTESAATLVLVDYGKSYVHDTTNGFFMLLESKEGSGVISRCSGKIVQCYGFVSATYEFILSIMYTKN